MNNTCILTNYSGSYRLHRITERKKEKERERKSTIYNFLQVSVRVVMLKSQLESLDNEKVRKK